MKLDRDWPWGVRVYYGEKAEPPRQPGALAVETRHRNETSADIEVQAAESREDVGRVEKFNRYERS